MTWPATLGKGLYLPPERIFTMTMGPSETSAVPSAEVPGPADSAAMLLRHAEPVSYTHLTLPTIYSV